MFKPLKLAGPNEIVPTLLQQGTEKLVTYLLGWANMNYNS